jgi:hypothetical protein
MRLHIHADRTQESSQRRECIIGLAVIFAEAQREKVQKQTLLDKSCSPLDFSGFSSKG